MVSVVLLLVLCKCCAIAIAVLVLCKCCDAIAMVSVVLLQG